jgi:hypothetical protein
MSKKSIIGLNILRQNAMWVESENITQWQTLMHILAIGNHKQSWNDNNEINLKEIIYKDLNWTELVHDHG